MIAAFHNGDWFFWNREFVNERGTEGTRPTEFWRHRSRNFSSSDVTTFDLPSDEFGDRNNVRWVLVHILRRRIDYRVNTVQRRNRRNNWCQSLWNTSSFVLYYTYKLKWGIVGIYFLHHSLTAFMIVAERSSGLQCKAHYWRTLNIHNFKETLVIMNISIRRTVVGLLIIQLLTWGLSGKRETGNWIVAV